MHSIETMYRLPDSDVTLKIWGRDIEESELDKIREVLGNVWQQVDALDKKKIEGLWADDAIPVEFGIEDGWTGSDRSMATTGRGGFRIRLRKDIYAILPEDVLKVLIAHEMAHVFQHAIGKARDTITRNDLLGLIAFPSLWEAEALHPEALAELHADEMVKKWGFDRFAARAYLRQFFDFEDGRYRPRKKPRNTKRVLKDVEQDWVEGMVGWKRFRQEH